MSKPWLDSTRAVVAIGPVTPLDDEPERLDAAADRWERERRKAAGEDLCWLVAMAAEARKAAANLRAMRAARLRLQYGKG